MRRGWKMAGCQLITSASGILLLAEEKEY